MNLQEYERFVAKGLTRPYRPVTGEERAGLPRVNTPPKPESDPIPAKYLDTKYLETLEHNQKINGCCRRPEESGHMSQWFSTPSAEKTEKGNTIPDILVITCGECGRAHRRFFVGAGERHITEVR